MMFGKKLAHTNRAIREKTTAKLVGWLRSLRRIPPLEARKLWEGLYYTMYMTDQPVVQEEVARTIASLMHEMPAGTELLFTATFFDTMEAKWNVIDYHRMDKYLMLIRVMLKEALVFVAAASSEKEKYARMGKLNLILGMVGKPKQGKNRRPDFNIKVKETELATDVLDKGFGIALHMLDIFLDTLFSVEGLVTDTSFLHFALTYPLQTAIAEPKDRIAAVNAAHNYVLGSLLTRWADAFSMYESNLNDIITERQEASSEYEDDEDDEDDEEEAGKGGLKPADFAQALASMDPQQATIISTFDPQEYGNLIFSSATDKRVARSANRKQLYDLFGTIVKTAKKLDFTVTRPSLVSAAQIGQKRTRAAAQEEDAQDAQDEEYEYYEDDEVEAMEEAGEEEDEEDEEEEDEEEEEEERPKKKAKSLAKAKKDKVPAIKSLGEKPGALSHYRKAFKGTGARTQGGDDDDDSDDDDEGDSEDSDDGDDAGFEEEDSGNDSEESEDREAQALEEGLYKLKSAQLEALGDGVAKSKFKWADEDAFEAGSKPEAQNDDEKNAEDSAKRLRAKKRALLERKKKAAKKAKANKFDKSKNPYVDAVVDFSIDEENEIKRERKKKRKDKHQGVPDVDRIIQNAILAKGSKAQKESVLAEREAKRAEKEWKSQNSRRAKKRKAKAAAAEAARQAAKEKKAAAKAAKEKAAGKKGKSKRRASIKFDLRENKIQLFDNSLPPKRVTRSTKL